jgi:hypothetical protein
MGKGEVLVYGREWWERAKVKSSALYEAAAACDSIHAFPRVRLERRKVSRRLHVHATASFQDENNWGFVAHTVSGCI